MSLKVGDAITDMVLLDQDGHSVALSSLPGSNGAVIYFYPKDNTPGCIQEARDFQGMASEFAGMGVNIVGVSRDNAASHVKFRANQGLKFTLLSDVGGAMCEQFGVWREKKNFGKTVMGLVRSTFVVDSGGVVRKIYDNVRVKGHVEAVLADCQVLFGEHDR
ncbi:MAG: alkyl hydroperoxide reductase/Thiol specific antioxidant/Mal allergen [Magnetococcales bacterium]|nr:alkyl hydroperoxide reductase/Thiol specific antioxidant/Mal allergen [Magnetococcales bacterium]HIJ83002.1 peroxiredoxin [Magnetococcales bacterium]